MKDTSTEEELPREADTEKAASGEGTVDDGDQTAAVAAESSKKKAKDKTIKIKQSEYDRLVDEAATNKDKYVRLFAEFDNARKRMEREKMEFAKYANEEILVDLLGLFDNLERSLHYAQEHKMENLTKGLEMVIKEAKEILRKYGVEPIEAEGKVFDPHRHEILMQEDNDELEEGTVLQELQKGYMMGEKVIRTAKVKVSTKSSD
ncbi:MAG: nucleotide exchange factor GrpE [Candidatus Omnitrophica bacterium]|nr:nucleotide exchange factor GrpE [Candidatus Omnitrophota bacterium]